jgi:hypothetical protein
MKEVSFFLFSFFSLMLAFLDEDIIDEVLFYFRANVLFRNFEIMGTADRTLIYLTMHTVQCLVKCEKIEDKPSAIRELRALSQKPFLSPGESGFALGGMFAGATSKGESGKKSGYSTLLLPFTYCIFYVFFFFFSLWWFHNFSFFS